MSQSARIIGLVVTGTACVVATVVALVYGTEMFLAIATRSCPVSIPVARLLPAESRHVKMTLRQQRRARAHDSVRPFEVIEFEAL